MGKHVSVTHFCDLCKKDTDGQDLTFSLSVSEGSHYASGGVTYKLNDLCDDCHTEFEKFRKARGKKQNDR